MVLEGTVTSGGKEAPIKAQCKTGTAEGVVFGGSPGKDESTVRFASCTEPIFPAGCKVHEPIEIIKGQTELLFIPSHGKEIGDRLGPAKTGGILAVIEGEQIKEAPACAVVGKYNLTGTVIGRVDNTTEELEFTKPAQEGSALVLGGANAATLSFDLKQTLVGGGKLTAV